MTTTDTPAQQALARLVADQARPSGVTLWCDAHLSDLRVALAELGVPAVADALGMKAPTLYSYVQRRAIEILAMRVTRLAPEAPTPPTNHPEAPAAPAPPPRSTRRRRTSPPVGERSGERATPEASADYWRGFARGMMWVLSHPAAAAPTRSE